MSGSRSSLNLLCPNVKYSQKCASISNFDQWPVLQRRTMFQSCNKLFDLLQCTEWSRYSKFHDGLGVINFESFQTLFSYSFLNFWFTRESSLESQVHHWPFYDDGIEKMRKSGPALSRRGELLVWELIISCHCDPDKNINSRMDDTSIHCGHRLSLYFFRLSGTLLLAD